MQLVNEMTTEERASHEQGKRLCLRCQRFIRIRIDRTVGTVIWNSRVPQQLPPRRFVNAKMRLIEETWLCPECPTLKPGEKPKPGLLLDFEHVGRPEEIERL